MALCYPARGATIAMTVGSGGWNLTGLLTSLFVLVAGAAAPQFTSYPRDPHHILEGAWQSCLDNDGRYAERVYDHVASGGAKFEVHLGPRDEFAIFAGVQDDHREHSSPDNLLKPYRVANVGGRAKQRWEIPSLNLAFTASLAGGSRSDCENWFIVLEPLPKPTH